MFASFLSDIAVQDSISMPFKAINFAVRVDMSLYEVSLPTEVTAETDFLGCETFRAVGTGNVKLRLDVLDRERRKRSGAVVKPRSYRYPEDAAGSARYGRPTVSWQRKRKRHDCYYNAGYSKDQAECLLGLFIHE